MSIEAMKQALEALETCGEDEVGQGFNETEVKQAITSLRQAIADFEKQEPVAWIDDEGEFQWIKKIDNPEHTAFYTHPQPKREPLNDCEVCNHKVNNPDGGHCYMFREEPEFKCAKFDLTMPKCEPQPNVTTSDMKQEHVAKTAKQRHEWVGLTDEDDIDWDGTGNLKQLVEAVEAKLKEKNGYAEEKNT